jgi:hypothetical protein
MMRLNLSHFLLTKLKQEKRLVLLEKTKNLKVVKNFHLCDNFKIRCIWSNNCNMYEVSTNSTYIRNQFLFDECDLDSNYNFKN